MEGIIKSIQNHGTIVQVYLKDQSAPINFDHRMFSHLWEAKEGKLIGKQVSYDEENKMIRFEEDD